MQLAKCTFYGYRLREPLSIGRSDVIAFSLVLKHVAGRASRKNPGRNERFGNANTTRYDTNRIDTIRHVFGLCGGDGNKE